MTSVPKISDTEWEVMKVLWAKGPCSAAEIVSTLVATDPSWHPKTVRTFLTRLVRKKAVAFRQERRGYLYRPLVTEKECVNIASTSFLNRVFGGSLRPMLAHFVEHRKPSREEIEELKRLLEEE